MTRILFGIIEPSVDIFEFSWLRIFCLAFLFKFLSSFLALGSDLVLPRLGVTLFEVPFFVFFGVVIICPPLSNQLDLTIEPLPDRHVVAPLGIVKFALSFSVPEFAMLESTCAWLRLKFRKAPARQERVHTRYPASRRNELPPTGLGGVVYCCIVIVKLRLHWSLARWPPKSPAFLVSSSSPIYGRRN